MTRSIGGTMDGPMLRRTAVPGGCGACPLTSPDGGPCSRDREGHRRAPSIDITFYKVR